MNDELHQGTMNYAEIPHLDKGNVMTAEQNSDTAGGTCHRCGQKSEKLFQNNTCKSCLVDSFTKVKKIIDIYRAGYGENSINKSYKN